jgi:hypothetical protein
MELWNTKYIDLVVPGFIEFSGDGTGEFQFGTVRGWLDSRFGNPAATSWVARRGSSSNLALERTRFARRSPRTLGAPTTLVGSILIGGHP